MVVANFSFYYPIANLSQHYAKRFSQMLDRFLGGRSSLNSNLPLLTFTGGWILCSQADIRIAYFLSTFPRERLILISCKEEISFYLQFVTR